MTEFNAQGFDTSLINVELSQNQDPVERLHRHLQQIDSGNLWQSLFIKIANVFVEEFWEKLTDKNRKKFLEKYHHLFMSICNPMPRKTADTISELIKNNSLIVRSGIKSVEPKGPCSFSIFADNDCYHVHRIINACRPESSRVGSRAQAIVNALVSAGSAQFNRYGGLKIDPNTLSILRRDGQANSHLFTVGQLAAGDLYYTGSLSMITRQIDRMVPKLFSLVSASRHAHD